MGIAAVATQNNIFPLASLSKLDTRIDAAILGIIQGTDPRAKKQVAEAGRAIKALMRARLAVRDILDDHEDSRGNPRSFLADLVKDTKQLILDQKLAAVVLASIQDDIAAYDSMNSAPVPADVLETLQAHGLLA